MRKLLDLFGEITASGDSAQDVNTSVTPLAESGNPIASRCAGRNPSTGLPPVPRTTESPASGDHLLIPTLPR
jgi:hypothetical protein